MTHQIKMPKVAMAMNEGTITQWYKKPGEAVQKGEILFEIETEKTVYEVEATASGILEIVVDAGETVKVETVVGALSSGEEEVEPAGVTDAPPLDEKAAPSEADSVAAPVAPIAVETIDRIKASPLAKKMAAQHNIDLSKVRRQQHMVGLRSAILKPIWRHVRPHPCRRRKVDLSVLN
jgi:pyruvate dehydrogenase E2 component (dihydrolipoamide acetyltransferase)